MTSHKTRQGKDRLGQLRAMIVSPLLAALVTGGCTTLCGDKGHRDSILGIVVRCHTGGRDYRDAGLPNHLAGVAEGACQSCSVEGQVLSDE